MVRAGPDFFSVVRAWSMNRSISLRGSLLNTVPNLKPKNKTWIQWHFNSYRRPPSKKRILNIIWEVYQIKDRFLYNGVLACPDIPVIDEKQDDVLNPFKLKNEIIAEYFVNFNFDPGSLSVSISLKKAKNGCSRTFNPRRNEYTGTTFFLWKTFSGKYKNSSKCLFRTKIPFKNLLHKQRFCVLLYSTVYIFMVVTVTSCRVIWS